jgi:ubiquinone/menaquinone biosynthesis C-methylase UbiE
MERTPEPELMTAAEQVAAYAAADFAEPHDHFVRLLSRRLADLAATGRAADLGCGPCDIAIRFARAYPSWTIDAVDGSQAMLDAAVPGIERAGISARIACHCLRLPGEPPSGRQYDLVFSNSLLHHLADPSVLWSTLHRWTRPGGAVFVMDLLRPHSRDAARGLVDAYATGEPEVLRSDFYNSLLAAYRPDELRSQLESVRLADLAVEVVSDRHWIAWGRL